MKYYCKEFEETVTNVVDGSPIEYGWLEWIGMTSKNKWYIMHEIDMDCGSCKWKTINYCPFCGVKLEEKKCQKIIT